MTKKQSNILVIVFILISFSLCLSFYSNLFKVKDTAVIENNKSKINIEDTVTLAVLNKIYKVSINNGDTIYNVMTIIENKKENNFSFKAKDYGDMGYLVEEINGVKGETGKYWIYSVNGEEASVSVSKYILNGGDNILWEQKAF